VTGPNDVVTNSSSVSQIVLNPHQHQQQGDWTVNSGSLRKNSPGRWQLWRPTDPNLTPTSSCKGLEGAADLGASLHLTYKEEVGVEVWRLGRAPGSGGPGTALQEGFLGRSALWPAPLADERHWDVVLTQAS
jgi:hypothetical protein